MKPESFKSGASLPRRPSVRDIEVVNPSLIFIAKLHLDFFRLLCHWLKPKYALIPEAPLREFFVIAIWKKEWKSKCNNRAIIIKKTRVRRTGGRQIYSSFPLLSKIGVSFSQVKMWNSTTAHNWYDYFLLTYIPFLIGSISSDNQAI